MPALLLKASTRFALADSQSYQSWYLDQLAQLDTLRYSSNEQAVKRRVDREAGRFNEAGETWALDGIRLDQFPINDMTQLLTDLNGVEDKAVEVLEYPTFLTVTKTQYEQDDVPNYMPNNDVLDDDGNVVRNKKWSEWKAEGYTHRRNNADTEYYVPMNSDNAGYYVSGVTITRLEAEPYVMDQMGNYPSDGVEV